MYLTEVALTSKGPGVGVGVMTEVLACVLSKILSEVLVEALCTMPVVVSMAREAEVVSSRSSNDDVLDETVVASGDGIEVPSGGLVCRQIARSCEPARKRLTMCWSR